MPRTKGSKNRVTASTDFDAQIAKLQKDKAMLEEGLSKTVAQIEELKTDIKSLREGLKPQKAEIKQTEKEIAKQQLLNEGKPEAMLERIIPGKVKAILKEVCLVDQKFVKNGDLTVAQYVESVAKEIGKPMKVVEMVRYEVGEGIEKKEENFAEEVAKQMGAN